MKDPITTDNYILKLTGKAELPSALVIGNNYETKIHGTITSITESDNNDGSHALYYKFEPVRIEIMSDKGEALKLKDTRSLSQLFRARMWGYWQKAKTDKSFDDFYQGIMENLINQSDEVAEMYQKP